MSDPICVIGAGPAGLTAAAELVDTSPQVVVLEADDVVGGIARTATYRGFRFDIGGHRFFTKVAAVSRFWNDVLGGEMLKRPRLSRIYYNGAFFDYPLKPLNALTSLGMWTSLLVGLSYVKARLRPIRPEVSFEDWVVNRFGWRLYSIFFKTYTEKVWGMPCRTIGAQWAAQRIKGLSLWIAIREMVRSMVSGRGSRIRTLVDEFEYPRLGPGQMWERVRTRVEERGARVQLRTTVTGLRHDGWRVTHVDYLHDGQTGSIPVSGVISTMPLRALVEGLQPAAPDEVRAAAARLSYRDFLTVALVIDDPECFPDNWIYVHDPAVRLGRIQNFKNWSPDMVPDRSKTCLGLEYFCFEGDDLWTMDDAALIALGRQEVARLGIVDAARVVDGCVVRMPKAYPVYNTGYLEALAVIRDYVRGFTNLQLAGRNGLHKYNNQDHAMVTAMLAVRALRGRDVDPWLVNVEDDYLEMEGGKEYDELLADLGPMMATQPLVLRQQDAKG